MSLDEAIVSDPYVDATFLQVEKVEVLRTPVLRVAFSDGAVRDVDLSETIARSRWFRTLSVPTTFETVEIIHDGRAIQWITGADYCVHALRILGDEQLIARQRESA